MNLITIKDLNFQYSKNNQRHKVLDDFELSIDKGEFVCILGESGCGKSTLIRILSGLEKNYQGNVKFKSDSTGVLLQDTGLLPWLNVRDNISLKSILKNESRDVEKENNTLDFLNLIKFEKYFPSQLSGGMKQRVALGRTLINHNEVLFLDEPFTSLDTKTKNELHKVLLKIWKKFGLTIIMVTHDIDEAINLSTRLLLMSKKKKQISLAVNNKLDYPRNDIDNEYITIKKKILEEFKE